MEQNEQNTTALADAPASMSRKDITAWLQASGINGLCTTEELSRKLGSISIRLLRQKIKEGKIKPLDRSAKFYVFKLDDICDFLMQNPRYCVRKKPLVVEMSQERFDYLARLIKDLTYKHFRISILSHLEINDVVGEVFLQITKSRASWKTSDAHAIYRMLQKVERKLKKKVRLVSTDPNDFYNEADENTKDPKDSE